MPSWSLTRNMPSEFIRLDARTNAADSYANVRDLQVLRDNSNIMLGRGIKKPILSYAAIDDDGAGGSLDCVHYGEPGESLSSVLFHAYIYLSSWTRELVFVVRAQAADQDAQDPVLYPVVHHPAYHLQPLDDYTMEPTTESEAKYTVTVPVPDEVYQSPDRLAQIAIFCGCSDDADANLKGATTITAVTEDYIIAAIGSDFTGKLVYSPSDASIEPRIITKYEANVNYPNAGDDRIWFDRPIRNLPVAGTDTMAVRGINYPILYSLDVYEKGISDFNELVREFSIT